MGNKKYQAIILMSWLILVMGLVTLVMTKHPIAFGIIVIALLLLAIGYIIKMYEARQDEQTEESKEAIDTTSEEVGETIL